MESANFESTRVKYTLNIVAMEILGLVSIKIVDVGKDSNLMLIRCLSYLFGRCQDEYLPPQHRGVGGGGGATS